MIASSDAAMRAAHDLLALGSLVDVRLEPGEMALKIAGIIDHRFSPPPDVEREELVRRLRARAGWYEATVDDMNVDHRYIGDDAKFDLRAADALSRPAPGWNEAEIAAAAKAIDAVWADRCKEYLSTKLLTALATAALEAAALVRSPAKGVPNLAQDGDRGEAVGAGRGTALPSWEDVARAIWADEEQDRLSDEYSGVPFDEVMHRPRYSHLRWKLERRARAVLALLAGKEPRG